MNLTLALTGASGAVFGCELLRALEADERVARIHFVASENSLRVIAEEVLATQCVKPGAALEEAVRRMRGRMRKRSAGHFAVA